MNYEEILNKFKENYNLSVENLAYGDFDGIEMGIGASKEVDSTGGEDEGSNWSSVRYFPDHDVYIKTSGWYQSYHGTDFEDWDKACSEVRPQEKTVTVYE